MLTYLKVDASHCATLVHTDGPPTVRAAPEYPFLHLCLPKCFLHQGSRRKLSTSVISIDSSQRSLTCNGRICIRRPRLDSGSLRNVGRVSCRNWRQEDSLAIKTGQSDLRIVLTSGHESGRLSLRWDWPGLEDSGLIKSHTVLYAPSFYMHLHIESR